MDHMRFENLVRDLAVDDALRSQEAQRVSLADQCYLILFTARSGSSWLTSVLSATKRLGFPEEFLNPEFVRDVAAAMNARTQANMLDMLRRRKRTPNGIFGMEVRAIDIELFGEGAFFEAFDAQTVVFNLWRDNIVAQGVSLYRAVNTGHYHSTDAEPPAVPSYDADEIKRWTTHILNTENQNLKLLAKRGLPARFLRYEDIMRDPATTVRQFADALRVDLPPVGAGDEAGPRHEKIGDLWNHEAEQRVRREQTDYVAMTESLRLIRRQPGEEGWMPIDERDAGAIQRAT
jgi:LPS sulfotransferase NodH